MCLYAYAIKRESFSPRPVFNVNRLYNIIYYVCIMYIYI